MKANTPEKLYLHPTAKGEVGASWLTFPLTDEDVKYIRADAFIEKAKKWFEKQNEWRDINGIKHCDMEDFEDFKNYMKGD